MKSRSLAFQIWVVLAGMALGILLILLLTLPPILRTFFTSQTYDTIDSAQASIASGITLKQSLDGFTIPERQQELQSIRAVRSVVVTENGRILPQNRLPNALAKKVRQAVQAQSEQVKHYAAGSTDGKLLFIARKVQIGGRSVTLVSYMWDTYQKQLIHTLYRRLILLMIAITALSWLPSIWLSRFLSRPLVQLQQHVRRIAGRDWLEPVRTGRGDEIGQLGDSIEQMRVQLVEQDERQQSLLQHVSHELKTPVMVIHSYAQSILDGVYPKGNLEGSVQVIEAEAERLERRVRDLLYMTKLDYMDGQEQAHETVHLHVLIEEAVNRLRWRRPDLEWTLELDALSVQGNHGQLTVAIENLLDNQIRYAASCVHVFLGPNFQNNGKAVLVRLANDGPGMEPGMAEKLFTPFQKGVKGEFGLGLSIVQRVAALHGGRVWADNEPPGIAFYLLLNTAQSPPAG